MARKEARQQWARMVTTIAQAWTTEYGDAPLDTQWSETAFQELDGAVVDALVVPDPWVMFHREGCEAIDAYKAE